MSKRIKLKLSSRVLSKKKRRYNFGQKKHCRFTHNPEAAAQIDYKNPTFLRQFLTERGKILPARISGNSCLFQRLLAREIKKSRIMGLLPYKTFAY